MIRNIVFDIGGVLIRFMPGEAMRKLAIPEEKIAPLLEASVYCKWWQELDRGFFEEEEVMRYMQEDAPEYAKDIAYFMMNGKREVVEAFEYSAGWLKGLQERGYHTYLLTNYPASYYDLHSKEKFTFMPYVNGQIVSSYVEMIKPDPNIYRTLLDTYDLKEEECVFIDDRKENVEAAKKLGFHGIRFESYEQAFRELEAIISGEAAHV